MDTVEFLESVTDMWNEANPKFWKMMKNNYDVSTLVDVMRKASWGELYLKYQPAVREAFYRYPSSFLTTEYRDVLPKSFDSLAIEKEVNSKDFKRRFREGIKNYFLSHFNPNNIVGMYSETKTGDDKNALKRINDSGQKGIWFLTFPNGLRGLDRAFFDWDTVKTLLELGEHFTLGYSELLNSEKGESVKWMKIGLEGIMVENVSNTAKDVISWDFNFGPNVYWNLNQNLHLITKAGMTFLHGGFNPSFMNWTRNPF
jgi:hypothetical protein